MIKTKGEFGIEFTPNGVLYLYDVCSPYPTAMFKGESVMSKPAARVFCTFRDDSSKCHKEMECSICGCCAQHCPLHSKLKPYLPLSGPYLNQAGGKVDPAVGVKLFSAKAAP